MVCLRALLAGQMHSPELPSHAKYLTPEPWHSIHGEIIVCIGSVHPAHLMCLDCSQLTIHLQKCRTVAHPWCTNWPSYADVYSLGKCTALLLQTATWRARRSQSHNRTARTHRQPDTALHTRSSCFVSGTAVNGMYIVTFSLNCRHNDQRVATISNRNDGYCSRQYTAGPEGTAYRSVHAYRCTRC